MRPSVSPIMIALPANTNQNSTTVWADDIIRVSAQALITGSGASGTLQLQGSNDIATGKPPNQFTPTNWSNVGSSVAVAAAGVFLIPYTEVCYNYLRVTYTDSSGGTATGTISINLNAQGL